MHSYTVDHWCLHSLKPWLQPCAHCAFGAVEYCGGILRWNTVNYSTVVDQSDYSISTILYNNIKYSPLDRELSTLCMASICLPTYLQNINYTRVPILDIVMFFWDGDDQTLRSKSCVLATRRLFSTDFLPAMPSNHSSMTNKLELLKNRWVHNLLAMCSTDRALAERTDNGRSQNFTLY